MAAEKLERLLNLTALLLDASRPIRREAIRQKLPGYPEGDEAFRRQFERDKDDLRAMGIPLSTEPIPGVVPEAVGYRIHPEDYYLRDPGLATDELAALHLAASAVRVEGLSAGEGLRKLGSGVAGEPGTPGPQSGVEVSALPGDENLALLFGAVGARQPVAFDYRGERRQVDPYRLELRRGRWYLWGHDHGRADDRSYRLDRIEGRAERLEGAPFEPPAAGTRGTPGAEREPWELGEGEPVRARIRIDGPPATWAMHHLGPDAVVERHDDAVVVELDVLHRDGFRSFVLSLLYHAEVLSPPELRADVVDWLLAITGEGDGA